MRSMAKRGQAQWEGRPYVGSDSFLHDSVGNESAKKRRLGTCVVGVKSRLHSETPASSSIGHSKLTTAQLYTSVSIGRNAQDVQTGSSPCPGLERRPSASGLSPERTASGS